MREFRSVFTSRATCALLVVACSTSLPCHGDTLLKVKEVEEVEKLLSGAQSTTEGYVQTWLGADLARLDLGATSYVLDLRQDRFIILDHADKRYQIVEIPVDLSSMVRDEAAFTYENLQARNRPAINVESREPADAVDSWSTELVHWSISAGRAEIEFKQWLSRDLEVDEKLYKALWSNYHALNAFHHQWLTKTLELEGIPVKIVAKRDDGRHIRQKVQQLESVTEQEPPPGHYRLPDGYEPADLIPELFYAFVRPSVPR